MEATKAMKARAAPSIPRGELLRTLRHPPSARQFAVDGWRSFDILLSQDEWEQARRLIERGERKLSDYGGELPGTEPPEEWKRYFDWQRQLSLSEFGSDE